MFEAETPCNAGRGELSPPKGRITSAVFRCSVESPLVVFMVCLYLYLPVYFIASGDVGMLSAFVAAWQKNNDLVSRLNKVHPVAGFI